MGGRVSQFRVSRTGGYVVTDTNNFWIALAPYFFPIYSILALLLYGGIGMFVDVEPYRRWLFGLVGFTWSFHVTFAIWMLWEGQTDLVEHGTFFSMMVIYLVNFSVLSIMLIVASRDVTFSSSDGNCSKARWIFPTGSFVLCTSRRKRKLQLSLTP